jgi:hypothetical protein
MTIVYGGIILNRKIVIFLLCCIIAILVFIFLAYGKNILRQLKQSVSLNYHAEIAYIELGKRFSEDESEVRIDDHEDIEKILNFLNSLGLIEENVARHYPQDLSEIGYFTIDIILSNPERVGDAPDLLSFETDYIIFTPKGSDWKSIRYYIKNSGYDNQTKNSKVYQFLCDFVGK